LAAFFAIRHFVFAVLLSASLSYGYTVLTQEAIIDSVWGPSVKKLLCPSSYDKLKAKDYPVEHQAASPVLLLPLPPSTKGIAADL
jgi:hypothetical protein